MLRAFSDRLREARLLLRANQTDFASWGGVKKNSQIKYEGGETAPSVEYLLRLEPHGVDIGYVLTGRRADGGFSADHGLLFDLFGKLSARERDAVMHLMMILAGQTVTADQIGDQARLARQTLQDGQLRFREKPPE